MHRPTPPTPLALSLSRVLAAAAAVAAVGALAGAGCSGGGSTELDRLLDEVTQECGTLEHDNLGDPSTCPDSAAALQCFEAAAHPHVTQVFITEEGDPIYEHFFIEAGGVVLIRDTRADDFGPKAVTRTECAGLAVTDGVCAALVCQ